jgi:hypothetical protein
VKKKSAVSVLVVLVVLVAAVGTAAASNSKTIFRTLLDAAPGVESDAHGNAVFQLADNGSEMKFKLIVNGLDNPTMAHIHVSDTACALTPPVLWLYPGGPPPSELPGTFNGLLSGRTVTSADLFQPASGNQGINSLDDLRGAIESGRAYVLVHTTQNPPGEICGVIQ